MIAAALAIAGLAVASCLAAVLAVDLGWQPPAWIDRFLSLDWI